MKLSNQGDGLSSFLCSLEQSLWLQGGKWAIERKKSKDDIACGTGKKMLSACARAEKAEMEVENVFKIFQYHKEKVGIW